MNRRYMLSIACGMYLFTGSAVFAAPGIPYTDEWIEGRISGAYAYNDQLDSSNISVDSDSRHVTISGSVPSEVERDYAGRIARAVDGVEAVKNELKVDESLTPTKRSSFGQKLEDARITASVKAKLIAHRGVNGFAIDVDTLGDVVNLKGSVKTDKEKSLAEQLAFDTSGVREVKNELKIEPTSRTSVRPGEESKDAATAFSDAWISTKARSILAFSDDFPGSKVDVTTVNGKVKLEGRARSPEQKQKIAETISDVSGVKAVDNQLIIRKQYS